MIKKQFRLSLDLDLLGLAGFVWIEEFVDNIFQTQRMFSMCGVVVVVVVVVCIFYINLK